MPSRGFEMETGSTEQLNRKRRRSHETQELWFTLWMTTCRRAKAWRV